MPTHGCLRRRSRSPGIPLTALVKAEAALEKKKKHFRNDLINYQTLPPHTPTLLTPSLLFILPAFLRSSQTVVQTRKRAAAIFFFSLSLRRRNTSSLVLPLTSPDSD